MPRVQTVTGRTVGTDRAPTAYQDGGVRLGRTGAALEQAGQQLGQVGNLMARRAQEMREEEDAQAAMLAYTGLAERVRSSLSDPEKGYLNRRGADAMGISATAAKELDGYAEEAATGLSAGAAKAFRALWQRRRESELDALARHEAGERRTYKDATTKALLETSVADAVDAYGDPARVDNALVVGRAAILANAKGLPPDAVDLQQRAFVSQVRKGIALRLAQDDPAAAMRYVEQHKADLAGEDETEVMKALKPAARRAEAIARTDAILARAGTNLEAAYAAAQGIEDPELREAVESRISANVGRMQAAERQQQKAANDAAWRRVMADGSMDRLTLQELSSLTQETVRAMEAYLARGGKVKTDPAAYNELNRLAAQDPDAFVDADLTPYITRLAPSDWQKFSDLQRTVSLSDQRGQEARTGQKTRTQLEAEYLKVLGIKPDGPPSQAARAAAFSKAFGEKVEAFTRENGKPPKESDLRAIADRLVIEGRVEGSGWLLDDTRRAFELTDAERPNFRAARAVSDIPAGDAAELRAGMEARLGRKVSDAEVVERYNRWAAMQSQ